ncbi:MAG: cation:proton antiporter, partial [Campylobacterota bacterium]|nr:cation:proton antiporter [Campylobacterota bacterium]
IVFIIISNIINIETLKTYYLEIIIIFFITTSIRFISIFSMIKKMKLPMRWSYTLTFAGSKGALAIIMSHSLPADFIYREMFIAIIIGIVLLSTFIYTIILIYHINSSQTLYSQDIMIYDKNHTTTLSDDYAKDIIDILEKDTITDAYNTTFIEDILTKEIGRSQRYKTDLSILSFKVDSQKNQTQNLKEIGIIINQKIRLNDYFGKMNKDEYIILTSNTSISGAIVLAEKIIAKTDNLDSVNLFFGVTQLSATDDIESIYEKLEDALSRALSHDGEQIEIEI